MKVLLQRPSMAAVGSSYCVKENKPCVVWIEKIFKDCLCNARDDLSFVFGFISLICWGVAEIPQIITNFRTKSSHGISLIFLLTWIAGDIFNLVGCLLEPATLPTQLYTALLYTGSTVVLVFQGIYYDYICRWYYKKKQIYPTNQQDEEDEKKEALMKEAYSKYEHSGIPIPNVDKIAASPRKDYYYTSARSLAGSATPPVRSHLRKSLPARSGPSAIDLDNDSSSDDDNQKNELPSKKSVTQPRPIPRSVGFGAFLATSVNLPPQSKAMMGVFAGFSSTKLLQLEHGGENSAYGQWLGWMMAAIYMGGRIPQIWLNIKRSSVEGLNPLMFIFALIANGTYVGSILVRTTEWDKIRPNLPWLLDAAVCVVLDLFIIMQYVYYKYNHKRNASVAEEDYGDYFETNKTFVA